MQEDAVKWRKDRECVTCHHGSMTVCALSEAKNRGFAVEAESLADMVNWTEVRFRVSSSSGI